MKSLTIAIRWLTILFWMASWCGYARSKVLSVCSRARAADFLLILVRFRPGGRYYDAAQGQVAHRRSSALLALLCLDLSDSQLQIEMFSHDLGPIPRGR